MEEYTLKRCPMCGKEVFNYEKHAQVHKRAPKLPAKGRYSGKRRAEEIKARVNEISRSVPAPTGFFGEGGDGYFGFLWIQIPGVGKFIADGTSNGLYSSTYEKEVRARIKAEFPDAIVWINAD